MDFSIGDFGMNEDDQTRGEKAIKDVLDYGKINYVFEGPILVKETHKNKTYMRLWYPDFYLIDYGIVIEYFGMNTPQYKKLIQHKKKTFKEQHIDLVPVYNTTLNGDLRSYLFMTISRLLNAKKKDFHQNLSDGAKEWWQKVAAAEKEAEGEIK